MRINKVLKKWAKQFDEKNQELPTDVMSKQIEFIEGVDYLPLITKINDSLKINLTKDDYKFRAFNCILGYFGRLISKDIKELSGIFKFNLNSLQIMTYMNYNYNEKKDEEFIWGSIELECEYRDGRTNGMKVFQYRYSEQEGWDCWG